MNSAFVLVLALVTTTAMAQLTQQFEQVLVPFDTAIFPGQAAVWSAELRVRNGSDVAVNLFPEQCFSIGMPFPCDRRIDIPPRSSVVLDVLPRTTPEHPGVFLYVPTDRKEDVQFDLRVRDLSREADSVGASVPVVRSPNYRKGRTTLINVPLQSDVRATLRVYIPDLQFATFRVTVYDEATGELLVDHRYSQAFPTDPPIPPVTPWTFDFSDALAAAEASGAQAVAVSIERLQPDLSYWPMISITSNATNRVIILAPN